MTAGLLTFLLSATPVGAPPADAVSPGEEICRRLEVRSKASPYNPAVSDTRGRVTVDGVDRACQATVRLSPRYVSSIMGLVYEPAYCLKHHLHGTPVGYEPRAGDIVFFSSDGVVWPVLLAVALTHEPYHVGIVVRMADGSFRMLEAGPPEESQHIRLMPITERFESESSRVFIRRRTEPLTSEQSNALTGFAERQEGKHYALIRFMLQGTPIRSRGPIRTHFVGKSRGEPCSYFCSELVMEALVSAGLTDPETARPRATVMADLFYDESTNPYINKHLKLYPQWSPPQRWVAAECGR
jgi:hypothetical protein